MDSKGLIGLRSGRVVVKAFSHREGRVSFWVCACDCGNEVIMRRGNILRMRQTTSCGCARTKHGMSGSSTFKSWDNMLSRCTRPNNKRNHDYMGRGITVCDDWMKFENFLRDMGERPEGMTLGHFEQFFAEVKTMARSNGCSSVRCAAKPAQARLYRMKLGFTPVYETLEVQL